MKLFELFAKKDYRDLINLVFSNTRSDQDAKMNEYIDRSLHSGKIRVLDVRSYDVNGTYKLLFPDNKYDYQGLDMAEGLIPETNAM